MKIRYRYIIGLRLREADPNSLPKYPACEDICDFADICYGLGCSRYRCPIPIKYTETGKSIFQFIKIKMDDIWASFPSNISGKVVSKMYGGL